MLPGSYPKPLLSVIRLFYYIFLGVRTENNERIISDEDLPYYFAVSDVCLYTALRYLNFRSSSDGVSCSGGVSLALIAGMWVNY